MRRAGQRLRVTAQLHSPFRWSIYYEDEAQGNPSVAQIRADLTMVLADARSGKVLWRGVSYGRGASPDNAIKAAMAAFLPMSGSP